jgi:hypothetical protein
VALAKRSYEKADVVRRKMFELWVHDKDLQHAELIQVCRPSFDPSSLTLEHARPRPSSSHQTGGCSGQRACPHPSWVYRRRLTGRLWNTTSCLTVAPPTHSSHDAHQRCSRLAPSTPWRKLSLGNEVYSLPKLTHMVQRT